MLFPGFGGMPWRQRLEELEAHGESPLLRPEEAVALLRRGERAVGAMTCGW